METDMDIETILNEWKEDNVIHEESLSRELIKTPMLHSKYLEYYVLAKAKLSKSEKNYNKMIWIKRKYFRGEFDKSDLDKYGWSQWNGLKPSGSELNQLLEADSDMNDLQEKVNYYKTAVTSLEYILKSIQSRDYTLKSLIDYQKFLSGA